MLVLSLSTIHRITMDSHPFERHQIGNFSKALKKIPKALKERKTFGSIGASSSASGMFQKGETVQVSARTWPGMNKPGGTARISKCNSDGTYDVSYVLGGSEKAVEPGYISGIDFNASRGVKKREAAPKPGSFANKRRKSSPDKPSTTKDQGHNHVEKTMKSLNKSEEIKKEDSEKNDTGEQERPAFKIGDVVDVADRTWPGMNKRGGAGRITKCNMKNNTADVTYILGGFEKGVPLEYVCLATQKSPKRQRRPSARVREADEAAGVGKHNLKENSCAKLSSDASSTKSEKDKHHSVASPQGPDEGVTHIPAEPSASEQSIDSVPSSSNESPARLSPPAEHLPHADQIISADPKTSEREDADSCKSAASGANFIRVPRLIMYKPNLERFQTVRDVIASLSKTNSKSTIKVGTVVTAANEHRKLGDTPHNSSEGNNNVDTHVTKPFDAQEIVGHLTAIEIENHFVFSRSKGVVHFL